MEPESKITITGASIKQQSKHAVYFEVFFEDSQGRQWKSEKSSFLYDLEPFEHMKKYNKGL